VETALHGVTRIGSAEIVVVAIQQRTESTSTILAAVVDGALVVVVTVGIVGHELATSVLARIIGAGVQVVAGNYVAWNAATIFAVVPKSAGVTVVANASTWGMLATGHKLATVGRTRVVIVAIEYACSETFTIGATVASGARVAVIAGPRRRGVCAAGMGVTAVRGAEVVVVASETFARHTLSCFTGVTNRTDIVVGARALIVRMKAPCLYITGVVRT